MNETIEFDEKMVDLCLYQSKSFLYNLLLWTYHKLSQIDPLLCLFWGVFGNELLSFTSLGHVQSMLKEYWRRKLKIVANGKYFGFFP